MRKRTLTLTLSVVAFLWAGVAQAQFLSTSPDLNVRCQQQKLTVWGTLELCLKLNGARLKGAPSRLAECQQAFNSAMTQIDKTVLGASDECRYMDNGDGTISDLLTGLMWEKKTGTAGGADDPGDPHNVNDTFTWSNTGDAPDGTVFTAFLPFLNGQIPGASCFANHCDWRLPSQGELRRIVDRDVPHCGPTSPTPCIDPIFDPTHSDIYWTDTTGPAPGFLWFIAFSDYGDEGLTKKVFSFYVRAVRTNL